MTTERNSRLRSGSLTLPSGGLSNAFGPSIFSSSWLPNGNPSGLTYLDELRSVTSADSAADDFDVHTLDYLGLDESHHRLPPPAATLSELRNQAQAAIAGNLANPSRLRASTVSNPYRTRTTGTGSLLSTPAADEEEEYFENYEEQYARQRINSYETSNVEAAYSPSFVSRGYQATDQLPPSIGMRQRATTISALEDPVRTMQRRATVTVEPQYSYVNELNAGSSMGSVSPNPAGILKNDKLSMPRTGQTASVHFPNGDTTANRGANAYLAAPGGGNRSLSPKSEQASSQTQTPTRSLWIGNLDSSVTSEQLIHVFAPYGAIESLRLLPEKVFVSLMSLGCEVTNAI